MKNKTRTFMKPKPTRSAFTLIEMLVSVSLVLLMMTMFATMFQITMGSMSKQRGISENDQRARSVFTVMKKDFQHRTIRYSLPFFPDEDSPKSITAFSNRAGYLYFSMNEPDSGLDDLIQFTVSSDILFEDTDGTPYFGRATELVDRSNGTSGLALNPNQPETDDGSLAANSIGSSPAAEVAYFLRNGNLYRRVLLIREPISYAGKNLAPQPTAVSGFNFFMGQTNPSNNATYDGLFQPLGVAATDDFYRLYDYSAFAENIGGLQRTAFPGSASLSNETAGAAANTLADPTRRFGFNPLTGLSREHSVHPISGLGPGKFLGRFVHAETSTGNFNWPQSPSTVEVAGNVDSSVANGNAVLGNGNPFDIVGTPLSLNDGNGLATSFDGSTASEGRGGVRRVEDLLLTNVHEMKVEIWDHRLQRFVYPGHLWSKINPVTGNTEAGDYHVTRCLNLSSGPLGSAGPIAMQGHTFDSWHPRVDANRDGVFEPSPYMPYLYYPPRAPLGPSPALMPDPSVETPQNRGYWKENQTYSLGDVVFAKLAPSTAYPGWDISNNGSFEWQADRNGIPQPAFQLAYKCIFAGTTSAGPPSKWPTAPGRRVTDGTVVWEAIDNRRPLEAVRVQFRFYDKGSDTMKQLSLVIPLTDPPK